MTIIRKRKVVANSVFCSTDKRIWVDANCNNFARPKYMHQFDLHRFERDMHIRPSKSSVPRDVLLDQINELSVTVI